MDRAEIHKAACIIAAKCRRIIQGVLMDSEIHDADMEFSRIAEETMLELYAFKTRGG